MAPPHSRLIHKKTFASVNKIVWMTKRLFTAPGGYELSDFFVAGPQVPYGDPCVLGDVCATDNAMCRQGRCLCRDGFGLNVTGTTTACGRFTCLSMPCCILYL